MSLCFPLITKICQAFITLPRPLENTLPFQPGMEKMWLPFTLKSASMPRPTMSIRMREVSRYSAMVFWPQRQAFMSQAAEKTKMAATGQSTPRNFTIHRFQKTQSCFSLRQIHTRAMAYSVLFLKRKISSKSFLTESISGRQSLPAMTT